MDKDFLIYKKVKETIYQVLLKKTTNGAYVRIDGYKHFGLNSPIVIKEATNAKINDVVMNAIINQKGGKNKKQQFLYNPNNPKKSFDVYIDKNPNDTIPIKYTTVKDVKNTIKKLEKLYKAGKYSCKKDMAGRYDNESTFRGDEKT